MTEERRVPPDQANDDQGGGLRPLPRSLAINLNNPPKAMIVNLATNERFRLPFNPTVLEEAVEARFNRVSVPGLSHQRLQYQGTSNKTIPLELFMSQLSVDLRRERVGESPYVATTMKNFLESLVYPQGDRESGQQGTPRILFVWPRMVTIQARVTKITFLHRQFSSNTGATTMLVAKLTLEEDRDMAILMAEVREQGGQHYQGGIPEEGSEIAIGGGGS